MTGPPKAPGLLMGVGVGGFVDGIVLHQMLQWHHMLTGHGDYPPTTVAGLEVNTLWDGIFHAGTWVSTAVGVFLLWKAGPRRGVSPGGRCSLGRACLRPITPFAAGCSERTGGTVR